MIDPIIAGYIKELSTPCVCSHSHHTLRDLYRAHGEAKISELLRNHFAAGRAEHAERNLNEGL